MRNFKVSIGESIKHILRQKISRHQIGWLIVVFIAFSSLTYASSSGVLGSLFGIPGGTENNGSSTTTYRLDGSNIADRTVTRYELAIDSVTSNAIEDGAVGTSELTDDAVTTSKIANDAVETSKLTDNSVTSAKIANGTILNEDLAPGVGGKWNENGTDIFYNSGSVGIGTNNITSNLSLDVHGRVGATEYCDHNGNNCETITNLGSLRSVRCGNGEQLVGFDANGDLICENVYTYTWSVTGAWGACSANTGVCGAGTKTRSVQCVRNDSTVVDNSYCDSGTNPGTQSCSVPCTGSVTRTIDFPNCFGGTNGACDRTISLNPYIPGGASITSLSVNTSRWGYPDVHSATTNCSNRVNMSFSPSHTYENKDIIGGKAVYSRGWMNFTNNDLRLYSGAGGWGGCGSATCGGCLDYVNVTINYTY